MDEILVHVKYPDIEGVPLKYTNKPVAIRTKVLAGVIDPAGESRCSVPQARYYVVPYTGIQEINPHITGRCDRPCFSLSLKAIHVRKMMHPTEHCNFNPIFVRLGEGVGWVAESIDNAARHVTNIRDGSRCSMFRFCLSNLQIEYH